MCNSENSTGTEEKHDTEKKQTIISNLNIKHKVCFYEQFYDLCPAVNVSKGMEVLLGH
jgi:hypothetical protein